MEVKCDFKIVNWLYGGSSYSCCTKEATITESGTIISNFKGQHVAGKQNSDVEGFYASNRTIKYFPTGVSSFPNLKQLVVTSCGLVSLSRKDLKGLEDLELISFFDNNLTSLRSDLFIGFRKLKVVDFACNKLEFMSSNLLEPLLHNKLEAVSFLRNTKVDAIYRKSNTKGMTLKQLMDTIDEKCKEPEDGPEFDFSIITGDSREFPVHKNVLGIQSSVFAAAFNIDMKEKLTNRMVIDTFNSEAVEQLLKFFYTGRIPNDCHAMELFALAAKYDVPMLKMKCEEIVLRNLDETNAFEIFTLGHLHSADMKAKAFQKIRESMPSKFLKESLKDDPKNLKIIVEAARERVRMIQAAEDKFNNILEKTMEEPEKDSPESSNESDNQDEEESTDGN